MKKLLGSVFAVTVVVGLLYAVPTRYTETLPPQSPNGSVPVSNGYDWGLSQNAGVVISSVTVGLISQTIAQIAASTPSVVGQMVYCNNCAANGGSGTVCISTITTAPGAGNDFVLSTGTICK
jgi:hypothetical protein